MGLLRQLKSAAKDSDDEDVQSIRDRLVLSRADSQLSAASGEETSLESQVFPPSMPILTLNFDQLMEEVPLPVCPAIIPPKDIVSQSAADSSDNWSQNNLWPSSEESDVDCQSDSESLLTEIGNIRSSLMELNNLIQPEEEVTEVEQSCTTMTTNSADAPALSGSYLTTLEQAIERHLEILGSPQSHLQSPAFSQQADFGDVDDKSVDQSLKVAKPNPPIPLDLTFDHLLFNLLCPKEKTTGMGCQVDNFCQTDVLHPPEAIFPAVDADTQTSEESQKIDTNSSMKEALIEDIHHSQLTNDGLEPTSFSRDPEVSLLRMEDTDGWEELEDFDPVIWQLADQFGQNHADGLSPISEEFLEESDDDNISFDVSRGENCDLDDEQFWEGRITPISAGEPYVDFIPRENQSEAGDAIPLHVAAQLKPVSNQPFTQQTNSIPPDDCELLASDSSEVSSQCGIIRKRSSQKLRAGKKPMKLHYVDSFSSDLPSDIQSDNSREATLERNHESQVGWLANVTAYLNPWKGFCPLVTKRTIGNSPTTTVREEAKSPVDFRVFYTLPRAAQPSDEPQKASSKLRRSAPVKRINKTVIAVAQQSRHAGVKVGRSDSADSLDSNFNTFPRVNRRQRSDAVVFERPSETGGLVLTRDLPRAKLLQLKVNDRPDDRDQLNDVPMMPDENFCRSNVIKGVSNGPLQPYTDRQSKMVGDKLIRRALEDQNDLATVEITRL